VQIILPSSSISCDSAGVLAVASVGDPTTVSVGAVVSVGVAVAGGTGVLAVQALTPNTNTHKTNINLNGFIIMSFQKTSCKV
jgi:hypothetical protein